MLKTVPFLLFDGNCAEAMTFYHECLGGELTITKLKDSPMKNMLPPDKQERVINAHLKAGNVELSATDWMAAPDYIPKYGDVFAIFVLGEGYDELKDVFDKLSVGHSEDRFQDLHQLPIGTYGQFFDRYGYHWIFKGDPMEDQQRATAERFEKMFRRNHLPWRDHPIEPLFTKFFDHLALDRPGAKVVDIGCGDGWASIYAAEKGFHVWGVDSSPTAIQMAEKAASEAALRGSTSFVVGDALAPLPYEPHFFDAVIDGGLFHHILPENREKYLENILKVLKPDGYFYLSAFSKSTGNDVGFHFSREDIETIFGKWFQIIDFAEDEYDPHAPFRTLHFIMRRRTTASSQ